jgi:hypothetical protein
LKLFVGSQLKGSARVVEDKRNHQGYCSVGCIVVSQNDTPVRKTNLPFFDHSVIVTLQRQKQIKKKYFVIYEKKLKCNINRRGEKKLIIHEMN